MLPLLTLRKGNNCFILGIIAIISASVFLWKIAVLRSNLIQEEFLTKESLLPGHVINVNRLQIDQQYLIIGAISHPGYLLTSILKENHGMNINVTEDISSLGVDLGTWHHYDRLRIDANVTPSIVDYSNREVLKSHLEWAHGGTVVYIPSLLFNAINKDSHFEVTYINSMLENFGNLLEGIRNHTKTMRIVYFTPSIENIHFSQHATVIRLLSHILKSYIHSNPNIQGTIISFTTDEQIRPHSMLGCDSAQNIETIRLAMQYATSTGIILLNCRTANLQQASSISRSAVPVADREYIVGVNVRNKINKKNSFLYIHGFFLSCSKLNLDVLIFHDFYSKTFIETLVQYYSKVNFIKLQQQKKTQYHGRKENDARYYFLYEYILNHPEIKSIVFQDMKDGAFYTNPFRVMDGIGNNVLYAGTDRPFFTAPCLHKNTIRKLKHCYPEELQKGLASFHPYFNAGTFGGSRDVILTYLYRLLQYLDKTPHKYRCNMASNYLVIQNYFLSRSYSGYPFQAYHGADFGIPPGLAVKHKEAYPYKIVDANYYISPHYVSGGNGD